MESGAISDGQISASSEYDPNHAASHGRLNYRGQYAAWSARTNDANQWLQIDLISYYITVTRIATQGRGSDVYDQWVTKYNLQYSNDEVTFKHYREQGQNSDKVRYISFATDERLNFPINYHCSKINFEGWKGLPLFRLNCLSYIFSLYRSFVWATYYVYIQFHKSLKVFSDYVFANISLRKKDK